MSEEKITKAENAAATEDVNELRQIRVQKLEALRNSGKDPFEVTTAEQTITNAEIKARFEELENTDVSICGRIIAWRDMGKANFIVLSDRSEKIQVYVRVNEIGEEEFSEFKKWDIGDIVEVEAPVGSLKYKVLSVEK